MRRKLFAAALAVCAGIAAAYMTAETEALISIAAGIIAALILINGAGVPKEIIAFFALGVLLFYLSFNYYENGGLSRWEGKETRITGVVQSVEKKDDDYYRLTLTVKSAGGEKAEGKMILSYYGDLTKAAESPSVYDIIGKKAAFFGEVSTPSEAGNPGTFDYATYMRGLGIGWSASASDVELSDNDGFAGSAAGKFKAAVLRLRDAFLSEISPCGRSLAAGILFGDTDMLSEEEYEAFRANGTAHVLAVSGLHIGMIYGMFAFLKKLFHGRWTDVIFAVFLICYGFITLWSVSVTRAIILIFIKLIGSAIGRRYDMLTALSLTAMIILVREPYAMFGAGFQMSFLAVLSIIFLVPKIEKKAGGTVAVILGVQLPVMLYTAYNFNYFSPAGILANIPVVFLISLYVPAGMCCFIFFAAGELMLPSGGFLPKAADAVISGMSGAVLHTNDLFYLDGNFVTDVASPPLWLMIALYCGLYFAVSEHASVLALRKEKRRVVAWILAICIGAAACGICSVTPFDRAEAVMTDVGQGDCLHLKWPENTDILIDGGGKADYNVGEKTLKPYLLRNGITDIDLALATHLHTDHYKGIRELSECFDVKREVITGRAGQVINGPGGRRIEIIWPEEERDLSGADGASDDETDENLYSLIFKVYCDGFTVLVTGDITEEGEKALVERYGGTGRLKADVLKVSHHGSRYSTCDEFLEAVDPEIAIIGVGRNNYGHPADEVIEKLRENDIIVYRTDLDGAIGIRAEDGRIEVCTRKRESTHLRFFPRM